MYNSEHHVIGILVDAKSSLSQLNDVQLSKVLGSDYTNLVHIGMSYIDEGKTDMEYIKTAIERQELHKHYVLKFLQNRLARDNWIKVFDGMAVGKSEFMPPEDSKYLIIGVYTHDILVGLNKNKKAFSEWFVDHLGTYGMPIETQHIKYYHLNSYI